MVGFKEKDRHRTCTINNGRRMAGGIRRARGGECKWVGGKRAVLEEGNKC